MLQTVLPGLLWKAGCVIAMLQLRLAAPLLSNMLTVLKQITTTAAQLMSVLKRPRWKLPLQNVFLPRVSLQAIGMPASMSGGPEAAAMPQHMWQWIRKYHES